MDKYIEKFKKQFQEDWEELKKLIKEDDRKSFRLPRLLSNNIVVGCVVILLDLVFLMLLNYITNSFNNIPSVIGDVENAGTYLGILNLKFPLKVLIYSKVWRVLYLIGIIFMIVADMSLIYKIRTAYSDKHFNLGQKGDNARWTMLEEIKKQYVEIYERGTEYPGMPGFPISSYNDKIYLDTSVVNNLLIGMTRSGKGEMFVYKSLDTYSRAKIKPSLIINDMKAELYKSNQKAKTLQKRGYEVHFLDLQNNVFSMGYNPLEVIIEKWEEKKYDMAEDLTRTLVWQIFDPDSATGTEKYFAETGADLTAGLILAHVEDALRADEEVNKKRKLRYERKTKQFQLLDPEEQEEVRKQYKLYLTDVLLDNSVEAIPDDVPFEFTHENRQTVNMYSIINTFFDLKSQPELDKKGNETGRNMLDLFFIKRSRGDRARLKYLSTGSSSGKTKANIYSTMTSKLSIYTMESVAKMTAESSLKIEDIGFGEKPVAVFLGIPDADTSKHQIAVSFIRQVYAILAAMCWDGGTCKRPVKFILDEAGNMPAIEGLANIVTVCLGRLISFDFYVQAIAQFEELYGKNAKTIISNCGNKVYIKSDDPDTNEQFAKWLGTYQYVNLQRNGEKLSLNKNFMEQQEDKPLMTAYQLSKLTPGECVVIRAMKTKDNNGEDVYMTPILNSKKNGTNMKLRYEYLEEDFPTPTTISLREVNTESREHIKINTRIWNYTKSFQYINEDMRKEAGNKLKICDLSEHAMDALITTLEKVMSEEQKQEWYPLEEIPLETAEIIIESIADPELLSIPQQKSLLALINHFLTQQEERRQMLG